MFCSPTLHFQGGERNRRIIPPTLLRPTHQINGGGAFMVDWQRPLVLLALGPRLGERLGNQDAAEQVTFLRMVNQVFDNDVLHLL